MWRWKTSGTSLALAVVAASCGGEGDGAGGASGTSAGGVSDAAPEASVGGSSGTTEDANFEIVAEPPPDPSPNAGGTCKSVVECSAGLECVGARLDAGPIAAGGICTTACDVDAPDAGAACASLDQESVCADIGLDGKSYCTRRCTIGPVTATSLNPNKCFGRSDSVCVPTGTKDEGYCAPLCNHDLNCPDGNRCDPRSGLCVSAPQDGDPIGTTCAGSEDQSCAGRCEALYGANPDEPVTFMCTKYCTLGAGVGCGWSGADVPDAYCLLRFTDDSGAGDLGACAELCDCDSECSNPDLVCLVDLALYGSLGRLGFCGDPALGGGLVDCPIKDGGAGDASLD